MSEPLPPPQWGAYIQKHGWGPSHTLRCKEWEDRLVSNHRKRPFVYQEKRVRCSLWAGHGGEHTWHGRVFGKDPQ